ncbi:MAG: hypothetical protein HXS44_10540 [Theionarchaea archaeon]|nr:hypothetical protein [Theionarchaea archaeon]
MRYRVILVVLLIAMCIGQEEPSEESGEGVETSLPPSTPPPIPDGLIKSIIQSYFDALNQRDLDTLEELTHPYYVADAAVLMDFVLKNNISFKSISPSILMEDEEYRSEMLGTMSELEFAEKVGKRGLSYDIELIIVKLGKSYPDCYLFIEIGETEDGWKVLDPEMLQLVLESYLEVIESGEE